MSDTVKAAAPSELTDEQIAEAMYRAFLDDPVAKVRSPEHVKDWRRVFDAAIAALSTESPQEATPAPSAESDDGFSQWTREDLEDQVRLLWALRSSAVPVAWGLLKPDGTLEYDLVGTKADCEFWSRAERELQSGWPVVPLYLATPAPSAEPIVPAAAPSTDFAALLAVAERLARVVDSSDYGGAEEDLKLVADYARAALSTESPQEATAHNDAR